MRSRWSPWQISFVALLHCNLISGAYDLEVGAPSDGGAAPISDAAAETVEETPDTGPAVSQACAEALAGAQFDFEGDDRGWTHHTSDGMTGSWPFDPWSRGLGVQLLCPSGECFGAELGRNYAQCQRGELVSPKLDMSACAGEPVVLSFRHAYAFWTGSYKDQTWFDGGVVELSGDDGATWTVPDATYPGVVRINPNRGAGFYCTSSTFQVDGKRGFVGVRNDPVSVEIVVPPALLTSALRIRFSQASGVSSATNNANTSRSETAAGWRIDDVRFIVK